MIYSANFLLNLSSETVVYRRPLLTSIGDMFALRSVLDRAFPFKQFFIDFSLHVSTFQGALFQKLLNSVSAIHTFSRVYKYRYLHLFKINSAKSWTHCISPVVFARPYRHSSGKSRGTFAAHASATHARANRAMLISSAENSSSSTRVEANVTPQTTIAIAAAIQPPAISSHYAKSHPWHFRRVDQGHHTTTETMV